MKIDLHIHTHHSDGTWSPQLLIEHCNKIGMTHIAVTDHDTTAGLDEAREAAGSKLEVIDGVEINTIEQKDPLWVRDIHILGYFIDKNSKVLQGLLQRQRQARVNQMHSIIEALAKDGIKISEELVRECGAEGAIGKAHITKALVKAGAALDIHEAYKRFILPESPYFVKRQSATPEEAIAAIKAAGGIASIAHPGKDARMEELISRLKDGGLDAIEVYHRAHGVKQIKRYVKLAHKNNMLITGGSDCHGPYEEFEPSVGTIAVPPDVLVQLKTRKEASLT